MGEDNKERVIGTWYTIAAFLLWGFLPIYWKALKEVPAIEILPHRIVWSFIFLALFNGIKKRWPIIRETYSIGAATTAEFKAYQISPVDDFSTAPERDELVVLGQVRLTQ